MKRTGTLTLIFAILMAATSCFKEDVKIPPHQPGTVSEDTIPMTITYKNQVYFDLKTGQTTGTNIRWESDLAFNCAPDGWIIRLNTSDMMFAGDLGEVAFGTPKDTAGVKWKFDKSDGNTDSLAIGRWFSVVSGDTVSNNHVFLLNAGIDDAGNPLGFYQVIFDRLKNGVYHFRYASLDGIYSNEDSVKKDPSVNYLYYSFIFESKKPFEPARDNWDLLFTQYTTMLFTDLGEPYPYLVTGVLINPNGVKVAMDTSLVFDSITSAVASQLNFSTARDFIGYDWKRYSFETGSYTVDFNKSFIIRTTRGYLFKLRFVGFYNSAGEKGYPVIEFQEL
jgi:hypothetical protein